MNKGLKIFVVACLIVGLLCFASAALLKYLGIQLNETFLELEDNIIVIEKDPPPAD